jgi:hypothetical protein
MKIPPRLRFAPAVAVEDPECMRARLREAAAGRTALTSAELIHIADSWGPVKRDPFRPSRSAILKRSKSFAVAYTFIRFLDQERNRKDALQKTAECHECSEHTVEKHLAFARTIPEEKIQRVLGRKPRRK